MVRHGLGLLSWQSCKSASKSWSETFKRRLPHATCNYLEGIESLICSTVSQCIMLVLVAVSSFAHRSKPLHPDGDCIADGRISSLWFTKATFTAFPRHAPQHSCQTKTCKSCQGVFLCRLITGYIYIYIYLYIYVTTYIYICFLFGFVIYLDSIFR